MRLNVTVDVHRLSILKMNCSKRYSEFGMMKGEGNLGHYMMRNLVNITVLPCDYNEV
jgi:hypothetical protein